MKTLLVLASLLALGLTACGTGPTANGNDGNDMARADDAPESCYAESGLGEEAPAPERELFVLVDQTTALDDRLIESLVRKVSDYLAQAPSRVTLASFSATTAANHSAIDFTGEAELPFDEARRDTVNARALAALDMCLEQMQDALVERTDQELRALVRGDSGDHASSEIMAGLTELAQAIAASPADEKTVLIVSDMLEHRGSTSFYANRTIADIDSEAALAQAESEGLIADFGGAKVAVLGLGRLPPESDATATRDTARLAGLRRFWTAWIERSNGQVGPIGQPDLMVGL